MNKTLQTNHVSRLSAAVVPLDDGYHFMFTSRPAHATSTEEHVKFQRQFSANELRALRDLIDQQLRTDRTSGKTFTCE